MDPIIYFCDVESDLRQKHWYIIPNEKINKYKYIFSSEITFQSLWRNTSFKKMSKARSKCITSIWLLALITGMSLTYLSCCEELNGA